MGFNFKSKKRKKIQVETGNNVLFMMIGAGGASSYLAYELSQIASLSKKRTDIIMIDRKTVKPSDIKNCKFIKEDEGLNKAEVTAKRCSSAFDIDIEVYRNPILRSEQIIDIFKSKMGYYPVIICSEPNEENLQLLKVICNNLTDVFIITGNECEGMSEVTITCKHNGIFITKNFLEDIKALDKNKSTKYDMLEVSKNMFLYLDDLLCERDVLTERVLIDTRKKVTVSKYIGEATNAMSACNFKNVITNVGDKIACIVIGLGGTGASIAYEIAHLASTSNKSIKMIFIDGDIIEEKNLNRQRFVLDDLNKYKSEVTAKRCRDAYGVDIVDSNEYITCEEDIYSLMRAYEGYTPVILGCSDSLKLRHLVCEAIKKAHQIENMPKKIIYIDAGNGEDYGQVNFTYIEKGEYITPDYFQTSPESLKDVYKEKLVTEMSCDELMNSAPQTKGANMSAAILSYGYLKKVINNEPIYSYMSYFNNVNRRIDSKYIN